jgi:hypothetical protein
MHGSDGFQCAPYEQRTNPPPRGSLSPLLLLLHQFVYTLFARHMPKNFRRRSLKEEQEGVCVCVCLLLGGTEKKAKTTDVEHPIDTSGVQKAAKDDTSSAYDIDW